ncbi:MAG TPA: hypothetical protein VF956_12425 [Candidatus Dormibacteraeota bacterium]
MATAANFYAQVMMLAGVLAVLAGIAVLVKLGLSQIDSAYAYFVPSAADLNGGHYGGPTISQQQATDLILAAMLIGVGLLVSGVHWLLSRFVGRMAGASPSWIVGGTLVALTVLCGLAALLSTVVGGYQVLTYFIVGAQQAGQFGDSVGAAVVFLPAWAVVITILLRQVRHPAAKTPTSTLASTA